MRGGGLPPAMLFTALGLALALAPRRTWIPSVLALLLSTVTMEILHLPLSSPAFNSDDIFAACWLSIIATALCVYVGREIPRWVAVLLSLNAGIWAAAVANLSGSAVELAKALPCVMALLPASWVARRYGTVPARVVSSWLIAVAVLAATLQLLPVTPGYLPDHLE
jgi:hypothetical protein